MTDFTPTARETELEARTTAFIRDVVIPYEADPRIDHHGPLDSLRAEMQVKAREAGVFAPHLPEECGGQGLSHREQATVFRAGVTAYMKHLANEIGNKGVTVNCVAPALIDTSHRSGSAAYSAADTEKRKKLTPLGRAGSQSEVTGTVAFLASMQAGFITGSTIQVEGGMVGALV